jgi:flagellar hook-associated protein 2
VSSPITFSGFNNFDFNSIINSIIQQHSVPMADLQSQQSKMTAQASTYATLATKMGSLQDAVDALSTASALTTYTATTNDASAASASAGASAQPGSYDVVVKTLARAQVTVSSGSAPDADTTKVATGGKLTIGGVDVTLTGNTTLQELAAAINKTANIGVNASVIQTGANKFQLQLQAKNTGLANAFTVVNAMTGGTGLAFTNTDGDDDGSGHAISGDSAADNAVNAADADVFINNVEFTSSTNTLTSAIPGATLTVLKEDPLSTVNITVAADPSSIASRLQTFASAYNNLRSFLSAQVKAAADGDPSNIGGDATVRTLAQTLTGTINAQYNASGTNNYVSQVGIVFQRDGSMTIDKSLFNSAVADGTADLSQLFAGSSSTPGMFKALDTLITGYTQSGGILATAKSTLTKQASAMSAKIAAMQERLNQEKKMLTQQYAAVDQMMSTLNQQSGALSAFNTNYNSR